MTNCKIIIPWYMNDPRFEPGTVADVGDIRLILQRREQKNNNNWRLYMLIRTHKYNGVSDDLKRGVAVAEFISNVSLFEAQEAARQYFYVFLENLISKSSCV